METVHREKLSMSAVNLGLAANILLSILKTTFGILGHSAALLAEGINSTVDVAYYIVVRVFMGVARKPADDEHPYGHRQMESIAALVVGAFVVATAIAIFWGAVNKIFDTWSGRIDLEGASWAALAVALFTVALKIVLNRVTNRIGQRVNNPAILALAYDHRNDILSASAASLGILLSRLGLVWIDPLAGALVAIVIGRTGIEILRKSSDDLMDTLPGRILDRQVYAILQKIPGVMQIEEVRAHRFGPYLMMNITIGVEGSISVAEGDAIASRVEQDLLGTLELLKHVYVHYHPARIQNQRTRPWIHEDQRK